MDVQTLIGQGRLEDAISLMVDLKIDGAINLQSRFNVGKRENGLGMIEYSDWARVQAQITNSALELMRMSNRVVVNQTTYNFITIIADEKPGNELALFNGIFRSLRKMKEDMNWPIEEIREVVQAMHRHIGMPDLIDAFEDFNKSSYTQNTTAYQIVKRSEFVDTLLGIEADVLDAIKAIVSEKQKTTGWREAYNLFLQDPSPVRWDNTCALIDQRLESPLFSDDQREQWGALSADVNAIPTGFLWKHKFSLIKPDIQAWVSKNMQ